MNRTLIARWCLVVAFAVSSLGLWQTAAAEDPAPRILVSGEGRVDVAPDMAILSLSVMREAETARAALDANSSAIAKVIDAMGKQGIEKRDLQTSNFSIQPRYTRPPRQPSGAAEAPRLVGYTVRNGLTVRVRDISKLGEILDTSVSLGVNEGGSIQFTNENTSDILNKARVKAVEDALQKGRTLAGAAGVKAGKILEISERNTGPRPMAMGRMEVAMDSAAGSVPIAAGENAYKVIVSVSLAIDQ